MEIVTKKLSRMFACSNCDEIIAEAVEQKEVNVMKRKEKHYLKSR